MMKFEKDIHIILLHQQFEQMKVTFQLNAEKLNYNYHKSRDKENMVTISHRSKKSRNYEMCLPILLTKREEQHQIWGINITERSARKIAYSFLTWKGSYKLF